jgi:hypothetical protein
VGALITLEQGNSLNNFISTGTKINALVSNDLLQSLFTPSSPLHDGAVIIQGDRIACASAYFPPTTTDLPSRIGARHRAAIGISEITDSITIVVSEKSGNISVEEHGVLTPIPANKLKAYLEQAILYDEMELEEDKFLGKSPQSKAKPINADHPIMEVETALEEIEHPVKTLADLRAEEMQRDIPVKSSRAKSKSDSRVDESRLELSEGPSDESEGGNPA